MTEELTVKRQNMAACLFVFVKHMVTQFGTYCGMVAARVLLGDLFI